MYQWNKTSNDFDQDAFRREALQKALGGNRIQVRLAEVYDCVRNPDYFYWGEYDFKEDIFNPLTISRIGSHQAACMRKQNLYHPYWLTP